MGRLLEVTALSRGLKLLWSVVCASVVVVGSVLVAPVAGAQQGPPPPPVGAPGHPVVAVAQGVPSPAQIAVAHRRLFIASPGDEQTSKGAGMYEVRRGQVSQIGKSPFIGVVFSHGTLFGTSMNRVIAWSRWRHGAFTRRTVIFRRPMKDLPFLETLAVGPGGRLYMGSSDAGDKGPFGTPLSGRVLSIRRDGSGLTVLAKGLRQPFGIAFVNSSPWPYLGNESDESKPTPPDFLVHAVPGSDFGFPACQWQKPRPSACVGKTTPTLFFPAHASPTGLVGRGNTIYAAFFGGTTKKGPEIRALKVNGASQQLVQSAVPLIGVGRRGRSLYFGDVGGGIWKVKI